MKILIAENSSRTLVALETALLTQADTVSFSSGNQAIAYLKNSMSDVDAILTDYHMSDGSGMDLIRFVQKECSHIPVILLTAYGSKSLSIEALNRQVFKFLEKPIEFSQLMSVISELRQRVNHQKKSDKIHKLGVLSQIIFHEIGMPLQSLLAETQKLDQSGIDQTKNLEFVEPLGIVREQVVKLVDTFNGLKSLIIFDDLDSDSLEKISCADFTDKLSIWLNERCSQFKTNVEFHSETASFINQNLWGSDALLYRACINLFQNAVEELEKSDCHPKVLIFTAICDADWYYITIKNSHNGSYRSSQVDLTKPLGTSKAQPHFGLGLYISNKIVEKHLGKLEFTVGEMVEACIRLPLNKEC